VDDASAQREQVTAARGGAVMQQAREPRSVRVESLRAVAALAVVICHAYAIVNGFVFETFTQRVILGGGLYGVDVFFCLSGYLLYLPFARRDFGGGPAIHLGGYAANRALRLLPLYYVVLAVLVVVKHPTLDITIRFVTFTQSFSEELVAKALDGPMWSLVVELHFYLALPALAWLLGRVAGGAPGWAATALVALGLLSLVVSEAGLRPSDVWTYSLPSTFLFFVPGMLLALLRARQVAVPGTADAWLLSSVPIWLLVSWDYDLAPLAAVASFLVVGSVVLPVRPGRIVRVLDLRALAVVGTASYSLYLWHLPILEWLPDPGRHGASGFLVMLAVGGSVSVVVALVSYRLVERPLLLRRWRWIG
jgi:peptidoglycan/LPS O-acetylase OafA/YrhL